jgi:hypothetical protein
MSIFFHSEGWLTIARLAHAWAPELAGSKGDASQFERDLRQFLLEDILNCRLDDAGPFREGRRLGLRLIIQDSPPGFLEGNEVKGLLGVWGNGPYLWNRILVMKEAVLDFADRRQLPPPSWWADRTEPSAVSGYHAAPHVTAPVSSPASHGPAAPVLPPKRGRRSWKREPVEEAMRSDIQQGRLTLAALRAMGQKNLAHKYGDVSRDTAQKARQAVLSELSNDKNDKRQFPTH